MPSKAEVDRTFAEAVAAGATAVYAVGGDAAGLRGVGLIVVADDEPGAGPFPAVLCVFYDAETSAGLGKDPAKSRSRAFGLDLAQRGFVTLCVGSPGGNAWKPDTAGNGLQPLSYLAYVAANSNSARLRSELSVPIRR